MRDDLVIGVAMVKDEADIVRASVGNMLRQCDHVIVADNLSTDGTTEILAEMQGDTLTVITDREVGYWQSRKMTELACQALEMGARWVVPFDADEIWCSRWGTVTEVLRGCDADYGIVLAELFDHMATAADDPNLPPVARMGWRRTAPLELPKVACRAMPGMVIEQGNHYARYPAPLRPTEQARLTVHHYPYRSVHQFIRKVRNGAAAYAATSGLAPSTGAHWRQWGEMADEQLAEIFHVWYFRPDPPNPIIIDGQVLDGLIWDPPVLP